MLARILEVTVYQPPQLTITSIEKTTHRHGFVIVNVYSAIKIGSIAVIMLMIIQVNNYAEKAAATRLHAHDGFSQRENKHGAPV